MLLFPLLVKEKVRALKNEFLKCCLIIQAPISYISLRGIFLRSLRPKVLALTREIALIIFMNQTMSGSLQFKVRQDQGQLHIHYLK